MIPRTAIWLDGEPGAHSFHGGRADALHLPQISDALKSPVVAAVFLDPLSQAVANPWHLRKLPGGELASLYIDCFERIWDMATPVDGAS